MSSADYRLIAALQYSVDPERYKQLLSPAFELEHQAPPLVRGQDREEGLEQIMIWRRKADTPSAL